MFRKKLRYIAPRLGRFRYYNRIKIFGFDKENRIKRTFSEKIKIVLNPDSKIVMPFIDIDITTYCNLRCKRCAKCIPYFHQKKNFSAGEIHENLELLTKYIDMVYVANIIGGEPFLNPELEKIIEICSKNKKIETLELTTNATIIPNAQVLRAMKDSGLIVHISNYSNIEERYIENRKKFIQKLKEYGIPYEYQFHEVWLDFGEIKKHSYSDTVLSRLFIKCPMNSCTVFNNKMLYRCGKASYLAQHNIESGSNDIINLEEIHSKKEMRVKIKNFFSRKYLPACQYCDSHPQSIVAAEQLEGINFYGI